MARPAAPAQELRRPASWQRLVQRLAWSRPGAWFFSRTLHHVDVPLLRLSGGRLAVPALLAGLPVVNLTTTGAKTRQPRTQPVVGMADGGRYVVIASNWGRRRYPSWYHNLRANPEAVVTAKDAAHTYVAREAEGEEREMYWRRAVELYPGFLSYERTAGGRRIPVFVLAPKP